MKVFTIIAFVYFILAVFAAIYYLVTGIIVHDVARAQIATIIAISGIVPLKFALAFAKLK